MTYEQKNIQFLIEDTHYKTSPGDVVYKLVGRDSVDYLRNKDMTHPSNNVAAASLIINGGSAQITGTASDGNILVYNATTQKLNWAAPSGSSMIIGPSASGGANAIAIGNTATATTGIAIGTNTSSNAGIAIGELAATNIITSTAIGWSSFKSATGAAANNTGLGYTTGFNLTTGTQNTAIGANALYFNTTGLNNVAVGHNSMGYNSALDGIRVAAAVNNNSCLGQNTMLFIQTGDFNTAIGVSALRGTTPSVISPTLNTATSNVCIGAEAMNWVHTSNTNCVIGRDSLKFAGVATSNCMFGYQAGFCNTTYNTTNNIQTNCAFGYQALYVNPATASAATISLNSAFGHLSMNFCGPAAINNVAIGANSMKNITASNNVGIGADTGVTLTTGTGNTLIGNAANVSTAGAVDRITIGRAMSNTADSTVIIGNNSVSYFTAGATGSLSQAHYVVAPAVVKASVGTYTITATEMQPGSVAVSSSQAAGETWTTATAALIIARLPVATVGASYIFYLRNEGTFTITLAAGAGVTFGSGTYTVLTNTCVTFKITLTSGSAVTMQRVVSGPL